MQTELPISEIFALLDSLDESPDPPQLLHEIQTQLESLIARHFSQSQPGI
jgi:hypothetical protein